MSNTDVWFGDRWVIGTGLYDEIYQKDKSLSPELHYQQLAHTGKFPNLTRDWCHPEHAFSCLTSQSRNVDYINYAFPGSSIEFQLYNLTKFFKETYQTNVDYTIFFCISGSTRAFFIDDIEHKQYHVHPKGQLSKEADHNFITEKWKNPFFFEYNNTRVLNQVVALCNNYDVKLHIIQTWEQIEPHPSIDVFDLSTTYLHPSTLFSNTFDAEIYDVWSTDNKINDMYINDYHLNLAGHKAMHKKLMGLLDEN